MLPNLDFVKKKNAFSPELQLGVTEGGVCGLLELHFLFWCPKLCQGAAHSFV
jgi:hypothetical protein